MEQAVSDLFEQFSSALIKTLNPNRTFLLTAPDNLASRDFIPDIFATLPSDFQKNLLELSLKMICRFGMDLLRKKFLFGKNRE